MHIGYRIAIGFAIFAISLFFINVGINKYQKMKTEFNQSVTSEN